MAKQFGGVEYHKSSGRWCIRFRIEGRTYRSFSAPAARNWIPFRVRENAEDVLDEIRSEIRRGIPPIAAIAPYVQRARLHSVKRWWDKWIEYQTARAEAGQITSERWRKLAAHLSTGHLDAIRETPIHQIDYATLEDLQRSLFDLKLAAKSVRHVMADVRTFLGWLEDRKLIQAIPKMPKINVPRYIPDIPSPAQQEAILEAIPWEHRGFFLARGYMGMRPREAVRARVEDYRRGALLKMAQRTSYESERRGIATVLFQLILKSRGGFASSGHRLRKPEYFCFRARQEVHGLTRPHGVGFTKR